MKKLRILSSAAALCVLGATSNGWSATVADMLPTLCKVVQKDSTNANANTYTTIAAALAAPGTGSNPAPSATNRYTIKVMPGVYSQGTVPLTMRAYVDIEGVGNPVITSAVAQPTDTAIWDGPGFSTGTIIVPSTVTVPITIRGVTVNNTSNAGGVAILALGQLSLENVTATASGNPTAQTHSDMDYVAVAAMGTNAGVSIQGGSFSAATSSTVAGTHLVAGVAFGGGKMKIAGATFTATGSWHTALMATPGNLTPTPGSTVDVLASYLTSSAGSTGGGGHVVECQNDQAATSMRIIGSQLTLNPSAGNFNGAVYSGCPVRITGSELFGNGDTSGDGQFAGSMVDVATVDPGAKVVNCWDNNLVPIANQ